MDLFHGHWRQHPQMHVYHYGAYEPSRLKTLAGRHATRQDELDDLLRAGVFVDLFRVVKQGVRVGSERYSIKNLEPLYDFTRTIELRDAGSSIAEFEKLLEVGDPGGELKALIEGYNADDCVSTEKLRDWLEERRLDAARQFGGELPRPDRRRQRPPSRRTLRPSPSGARARGTADCFGDRRDTKLLANLLDWHRREDKSTWWRFYELMGKCDDELLDEPEAIGEPGARRHVRAGRQVALKRLALQVPAAGAEGRSGLAPTIRSSDRKATGEMVGLDEDARIVEITAWQDVGRAAIRGRSCK